VLSAIASSGRPLRGIVHAAGLLDDATIVELTDEQLTRAYAPKVLGAVHLHELTTEIPLDFFVLFSSVTAYVGSAGQANYAAANACIDALASHRRAIGLSAITINWGPWSDIGLAAVSADRGARLEGKGLGSLTPDLGVALFGEILTANPINASAMRFDVRGWCDATASAVGHPLFKDLPEFGTQAAAREDGAAAAGIREALEQAPPGRRRRAVLESYLQQQVASVLKLAPARIDLAKPLRTLGLDSLMGLELRNRLESGTGISVPATLIWNYPTVTLLAPEIASRMGIVLDEPKEPATITERAVAEPAPSTPPDATEPLDLEALLQQVEGLTDDDARRLLAEER
jgi:acyl carrier protein